MKYAVFAWFQFVSILCAAQNVGIGTPMPAARLHIGSNDSALLLLQNNNILSTDTKSAIIFRTGTWYTGSIQSIGTSVNEARLGFFTYSSTNPTLLKESMSILDGGFVGIGNTAPEYELDVNGSINLTANLLVNGVAGNPGQALHSNGSSNAPTWNYVAGSQGFHTYSGGNQTILPGVAATLVFESPNSSIAGFNYGNVFKNPTNEFVPTVDGIYLLHASARIQPTTPGFVTIEIIENNTNNVYTSARMYFNQAGQEATISCSASLALQEDVSYVCRVRNETTGSIVVVDASDTYYSGVLIR
jgi:hypothetical protein